MAQVKLTTSWFSSPPDCFPVVRSSELVHPLKSGIFFGNEYNERTKLHLRIFRSENGASELTVDVDMGDNQQELNYLLSNKLFLSVYFGDNLNEDFDRFLVIQNTDNMHTEMNAHVILTFQPPSTYFLNEFVEFIESISPDQKPVLQRIETEEQKQHILRSISLDLGKKSSSSSSSSLTSPILSPTSLDPRSRLPRNKRRFEVINNDDYDDLCCSICLSLPPKEVFQCIKGHDFCAECLQEHMNQSATFSKHCPTCRNTLPAPPWRHIQTEETIAMTPTQCLHCPVQLLRKDMMLHGMTCRGFYNKLRKTESSQVDYLPVQSNIKKDMHRILVDWLLDVHLACSMAPCTLFTAVRCVGTFLATVDLEIDDLQLVGTVGLLIACRANDLDKVRFNTGDVIYVTDHAYDAFKVADMESKMLKVIGGLPAPQPFGARSTQNTLSMSPPTVIDFLSRFIVVSECNEVIAERARYFAERSLLEQEIITRKPSLIAASCLELAMKLTSLKESPKKYTWDRVMRGFTGYSLSHLSACSKQIRQYLEKVDDNSTTSPTPLACYRKFLNPSLHSVAIFDTS